MESVMAQITRQRQASWNTEFITAGGESFAGLYIAPNADPQSTVPEIKFQDVLDCLLSAFTFELSSDESKCSWGARPCAWTWALMPYNGIMDNTCIFPGVYGVQETLSMDLPFKAGKYYLIRHHVWCNEGIDCYGTYENPINHVFGKYHIDKVFGDCSRRVIHATPKPARDYRPSTPVLPVSYDGVEDHSWIGILQESRGPVAEGVTGAKHTMNKFSDDEDAGIQHWKCAITGMGNLEAGLTITHVVPAEHYEIYPITGKQGDIEIPDEEDYTLVDKWDMTWDREFNGIAMLDHYRSLWISRFWAIEPETLTIRVFAPYDVLIPYHGKKVHFPEGKKPDVAALRWHYRMCVYESLTARSARLAWNRELKEAAAASIREIESGRRCVTTYTPPLSSPSQALKRRLENFSLSNLFPHGDPEHRKKVPRTSEMDPAIIEGFVQTMSVIGEFSKKLGSVSPPRSTSLGGSSRGSASP